MTPKIIFFDIDETLYRKATNYLPESTARAIRASRASARARMRAAARRRPWPPSAGTCPAGCS